MLRRSQVRSLLIGAPVLIAGTFATCNSQSQTAILERAAHCSVTAWLSPQDVNGADITVGYISAAKGTNDFGHPIYLVSYFSSNHKQGYVFDIGYKKQDGRWILLLQNNAKFIRSGKDVNFVDPPLGGTWTQEHLIKGIERIATQPAASFRIQSLLKPDSSTDCRSYADSDRQVARGKDVR